MSPETKRSGWSEAVGHLILAPLYPFFLAFQPRAVLETLKQEGLRGIAKNYVRLHRDIADSLSNFPF